MSQLLREFNEVTYDKSVIKEAKESGSPIILKTILQRADASNQNNRIYPRSVLEREMRNYQKLIAEGRATGECDHPNSSIVSLERISHIVRESWWQGNEVWGKVEILNTPKGKIIQDLLEAGVKVGISSRGIGDTIKNESGNDIVDENFMLVAFDLVSEPSTHSAWLREGKTFSIEDVRNSIPKVDRINRIVNEILKS